MNVFEGCCHIMSPQLVYSLEVLHRCWLIKPSHSLTHSLTHSLVYSWLGTEACPFPHNNFITTWESERVSGWRTVTGMQVRIICATHSWMQHLTGWYLRFIEVAIVSFAIWMNFTIWMNESFKRKKHPITEDTKSHPKMECKKSLPSTSHSS